MVSVRFAAAAVLVAAFGIAAVAGKRDSLIRFAAERQTEAGAPMIAEV